MSRATNAFSLMNILSKIIDHNMTIDTHYIKSMEHFNKSITNHRIIDEKSFSKKLQY